MAQITGTTIIMDNGNGFDIRMTPDGVKANIKKAMDAGELFVVFPKEDTRIGDRLDIMITKISYLKEY